MKNLLILISGLLFLSNSILAQISDIFLNREQVLKEQDIKKENSIRGYCDYSYDMLNGVREDTVRHFTLTEIDTFGNIISIADFDGDRNFLTQKKFLFNKDNEKIAEIFIEEGKLKHKVLYYYDLDHELIETVKFTDFGSVNEKRRIYRDKSGKINFFKIYGPSGTLKYNGKVKYENNLPVECSIKDGIDIAFQYKFKYNEGLLQTETIFIKKPEKKFEKVYYSNGVLIDSIKFTPENQNSSMITRKYFTFGQKKRNIEKWLVIPDFNKYFKADNDYKQQFVFNTPPQFPGGIEALKEYIKMNLKYPKKSLKSGIDGLVIVSFVIDPGGSVGNIRINKSVDYELDNAAIELVKKMPKWKPALNEKDKETMSSFMLPINFIIE